MPESRQRKPTPKREAVAAHDDAEVVQFDTATITPQQITKLYPRSNVRLIAHLQAINREITQALAVARGRGVGASLAVALQAVDFAILFALRGERAQLKRERLLLRDVIAAWVMISGEGTAAAVDSANGIGSLGTLASQMIARWKPDYGAAIARKTLDERKRVVDFVCQRMRWLLPRAPDPRLVEEALGGPRVAAYPRTSIEVLVAIIESGGLSVDAEAEENKPYALERAIGKHKKAVQSRLPPG